MYLAQLSLHSEPEAAELEAAGRLESGALKSPGRDAGGVVGARSSEELLINADEADVDEVDHLIQGRERTLLNNLINRAQDREFPAGAPPPLPAQPPVFQAIDEVSANVGGLPPQAPAPGPPAHFVSVNMALPSHGHARQHSHAGHSHQRPQHRRAHRRHRHSLVDIKGSLAGHLSGSSSDSDSDGTSSSSEDSELICNKTECAMNANASHEEAGRGHRIGSLAGDGMCELIMNNKLNTSTGIGLDIKTVAMLQDEKLQQLERGLDIEDRSSKGFMTMGNKRKKKKGRGRRKKRKKVPKYLQSAPIALLKHPAERSATASILSSLLLMGVSLLTGLPLVAGMLLLLPLAFCTRHTCKSCAACQEGVLCEEHQDENGVGTSGPRFVSPMDNLWLHDAHFNHNIGHCLIFMEPGLDAATLANHLHDRILDRTNERGRPVFRRFMKKIVPQVGGFCWLDDDEFRIERHVLADDRPLRDYMQLTSYLTTLMSKGMPADRPLWDIRVLSNYNWGQETVLVVRVHQVLTDGMSLLKVLCNHLADGAQSRSCGRFKPRFGGSNLALNTLKAILIGPLAAILNFASKPDCNIFRRGKYDKLIGERSIAWSRDLSLENIMRIKRVTRSTLNDVLLAAVSGALRSYMQKQGISNPPDIKVNLPVDLRPEPSPVSPPPVPMTLSMSSPGRGVHTDSSAGAPLGTRFSSCLIKLPTSTEGAIPRLWAVRQEMDNLKCSSDPLTMFGFLQFLLVMLPYRWAHCILSWYNRKVTALVNSMPGPLEFVYLDQKRINNMVAFTGCSPDIPVCVTFLSYGESLQLSVSAERALMPEPYTLIKLFAKQIEHLCELLSSRRIPGDHSKAKIGCYVQQSQIVQQGLATISSLASGSQRTHPTTQLVHGRSGEVKTSITKSELSPEGSVSDIQELHQRLQSVQVELGELQEQLEAGKPAGDERREMELRLAALREQFTLILAEIKRVKGASPGTGCEDDMLEEDGELLRCRVGRRSLSACVVRRPSLTILTKSLTNPHNSSNSISSLHKTPSGLETKDADEVQRSGPILARKAFAGEDDNSASIRKGLSSPYYYHELPKQSPASTTTLSFICFPTEVSKSPSNSSRRLVTIQRQENPAGIIVHDSSADGFDSMYHCDGGAKDLDGDMPSVAITNVTIPPPMAIPVFDQLPPPPELPLDVTSLGSAYSSQLNVFDERNSTDDNGSMPSSIVAATRPPEEGSDTLPPHSQV
ncbi:hypothetical protein BIW11_14374 [Tropilaelaps mercedesae]|uniref:Uncharacterized protein n=1 Tax=Tropilaelaps mercedesae TaxID=418985 RepID=A0A1V9WXY2_9ACAR|nr:hypothetical protein BIW11_14374 [Tropilaelaps mercedesae]